MLYFHLLNAIQVNNIHLGWVINTQNINDPKLTLI